VLSIGGEIGGDGEIKLMSCPGFYNNVKPSVYAESYNSSAGRQMKM
jgi:hypothetical protein